jgi:carbon monoxide dehydrogenase subunit G
MSDLSYFESKTGKLTCSVEEVFNFVTDIRNFERFIPEGKIDDWHAESDLCSFRVPMLGTVNVNIVEKERYNKVVFNGNALKSNDFSLELVIFKSANNTAEVKVLLRADLNPVLKMMASKPISQFLERLVDEMERFNDWKNIRE